MNGGSWPAPLWLASGSPRRRQLLEDAGYAPRVRPPRIDDATMRRDPAVPAAHWVMALAYMKGRCVADELREETGGVIGTVLAADTVCVHGDRILGQPGSVEAAREMLELMRDATHVTMTGVCLIDLRDDTRWLSVDRTVVDVGVVEDERIDAYLAGRGWRGKAGAYNLSERIADGWPIECEGDPTTVMGLPMRRLKELLKGLRDQGLRD